MERVEANPSIPADLIIVTHNSYNTIKALLPRLYFGGVKMRTLFVDSGSTREETKLLYVNLEQHLEDASPGKHLTPQELAILEFQGIKPETPILYKLTLEENVYFTRAVNEGLKFLRAKGGLSPYILLLNPDCYPLDANWVRKMIEFCEKEERVGAAGALHLRGDGKIDHAGAYGAGWHVGAGEENHGQYNWVRDVEWATGASLLLVREALEAVGGQMPLEGDLGPTPHYGSDRALCLRMKEAGYRVVVVPVYFLHDRGRSGE